MTVASIRTSRSLAAMDKTLSRLREHVNELGLDLSVYDADGRCTREFQPVDGFCRAVCGAGASCGKAMQELALGVISEGRPAAVDLPWGCCQIAVPVHQRRRLLGAIVAAFPVREMLADGSLVALSRALGLHPEEVARLGREEIGHTRGQGRDFLRILEWMLVREQAAEVATDEISNLSVNLSTTYEELSLVYRISGQMRVTQSPREFFENICDELQEVMNIAVAAALIYAHPTAGDKDLVVLKGSIDLNDPQIQLIAVSQIAPQFVGSRPMVDNAFRPLPGSGVGPGVSNLIAAPLVTDKSPMGMLIGFNKCGGDFDSADLKLISSIASQSAVFLANNRLYAELQDLLMGVLHALTASVDAKDPYTCGHSQRVSLLSRRIAEEIHLPPETVQQVYLAGLLHDVGKIGIPEAVLCKPGRLTAEEYENMKRHPSIGAKILAGIRHLDGVVQAILTHHERPDGKGYPQGLKGEETPLEGRIVGLADGFDAMTSDRTYRNALPLEGVIDEIRRNAAIQFDPGLVETFLSLDPKRILDELHQPSRAVFPVSFVQEW